jgi:hypothetical protein
MAALCLMGCSRTPDAATAPDEPATLEPVEGSGLVRVTLSRDAADRLDIQTAPVQTVSGSSEGAVRLTIPYAAVLYDANGKTWTYTNPEPLVFVRAAIRVERVANDLALLSSGPPAGTSVVVVGAPELLGVEYHVGEE